MLVMLLKLIKNDVILDSQRISDWFYIVFWRIDENRLQNDCFYIVFWSIGKVMVDFMVCFGSTDPS